MRNKENITPTYSYNTEIAKPSKKIESCYEYNTYEQV